MFRKSKSFKFRNQESITEPIIHFKDQNFDELLLEHNEENLFEDPEFLADDSTLYSNSFPEEIVWMRPHEAIENPMFVVDEFARCDMDQGYIGNCWFIAACVGIMQNKKLFSKVVPKDQSFSENYTGMFRFNFWLYGEWVSVVVDDRLPFWSSGKLVFCCNKQEPNEFWGSLLEKAYAKVYGSYENLEAGQTYDALIDMSGGIQEAVDLKNMNDNDLKAFWRSLFFSLFKRHSIIGCSISPDPDVKEARLSNGLVKGHAFTVTNMAVIDIGVRTEKLLRVRNPWGNNVEWKGAWSDYSEEWDQLSERKREQIEHSNEADGEFWMSYHDFHSNFDEVQICHLNADSYLDNEFTDEAASKNNNYKCTIYHSTWEAGLTAGGCGRTNPSKYWTNPQFIVHLIDHDLNDDEDKACLLIALMQKDSRLKRNATTDSAEEYIQFRLFKIKDDVDIDEMKESGQKLHPSVLQRVGGSGSYINSREITKRFKLDPGYYLILPSIYEEDHEADFMLRIFTENPIETNALDKFKELMEEIVAENEDECEDFTFKNWCNNLNEETEAEFNDTDFFSNKSKKDCNIM